MCNNTTGTLSHFYTGSLELSASGPWSALSQFNQGTTCWKSPGCNKLHGNLRCSRTFRSPPQKFAEEQRSTVILVFALISLSAVKAWIEKHVSVLLCISIGKTIFPLRKQVVCVFQPHVFTAHRISMLKISKS